MINQALCNYRDNLVQYLIQINSVGYKFK